MLLNQIASRTAPGAEADKTANPGALPEQVPNAKFPQPTEPTGQEDAGLHVLLSNYQRQGPLH